MHATLPDCRTSAVLRAAVHGGVALVLCLCVALGAAEPLEPLVAGDSLTQWRVRISRMNLDDPASSRWVPGLIELTERDDVPWFTRRQAALTLGRLGPLAEAGVPAMTARLRVALDQHDQEVALWSTKALGLYGPLATEATPTLLTAYRESTSDALLQLSVLDTLSQIGAAHPLAIPHLIGVAEGNVPAQKVLGSEASLTPENLQLAAIEALGMVGAAATPAIPTLVHLLDHPDQSLRREAVTTLGKLGPSAEIAVTSLLERLVFDPVPVVRDRAVDALASIGPGAVGDVLEPLLASDEVELSRRVLNIYTLWGTRARPWLTAIEPLIATEVPQLRLAALRACGGIAGPKAEWVSRVVTSFADEDRTVRREAYLLFVAWAPRSCAVREQLENLATHPRAEVRTAATKALESCRDGMGTDESR